MLPNNRAGGPTGFSLRGLRGLIWTRCLVALVALALLASACRIETIADRAAAVEPRLVLPAAAQPQRTTRNARGRIGDPITVVELSFHTTRSISDLRSYYSDVLISQSKYSQTLNISTPGAMRVEYTSPDGAIYIAITAEKSQQAPANALTSVLDVNVLLSYLSNPS